MALYIPHSNFHLALLYVRPETFGPYCILLFLDGVQQIMSGVVTEDSPREMVDLLWSLRSKTYACMLALLHFVTCTS